ncbi:hypothetical protein N7471_013549 [Penicillium samsonianum]|uniref:uncharacterized protein n=1 Tax=Penicillium samsonianum TaxID=1882272 RepID=UPI002547ECD8|nr:uncharacterized protein N7471_013549 [Penicillium samsonianum]KAJ6118929.1 hypothetical protein N7471_013549 [Penicillium samsonianum]
MQSMNRLALMIAMALVTAVAAAPRPAPNAQSTILSAPFQLIASGKPNCTRDSMSQFADSVLARNISNALISHSLQLNRTWLDQEQLDLSMDYNCSDFDLRNFVL